MIAQAMVPYIGNVMGDGLSNMTKSLQMVVTSSDSAGDVLIQ